MVMALPHVPSAWHVCTPLPEHWVVLGLQVPVQTPLAHVLLHATAGPQSPTALHVSTPVPEQRVDAGWQFPVHVPLTQR
jgi:hypothetical protein